MALFALPLVGGSVAKLVLCDVLCAENLLKLAQILRGFAEVCAEFATEKPIEKPAFQTKIER